MKRKGRKLFMLLVAFLFICLPFTLILGPAKSSGEVRWVSPWTTLQPGACNMFQHTLGTLPLFGIVTQAYYVRGMSSPTSFGTLFMPGPAIAIDYMSATQARVCNNGPAQAVIQLILE